MERKEPNIRPQISYESLCMKSRVHLDCAAAGFSSCGCNLQTAVQKSRMPSVTPQVTRLSLAHLLHSMCTHARAVMPQLSSRMVLRLLGFVVSVSADVVCFSHFLPRGVDGLLRLALQFLQPVIHNFANIVTQLVDSL